MKTALLRCLGEEEWKEEAGLRKLFYFVGKGDELLTVGWEME